MIPLGHVHPPSCTSQDYFNLPGEYDILFWERAQGHPSGFALVMSHRDWKPIHSLHLVEGIYHAYLITMAWALNSVVNMSFALTTCKSTWG